MIYVLPDLVVTFALYSGIDVSMTDGKSGLFVILFEQVDPESAKS
jgi:hypothetical protein